ncbi:MAG: hypothetical protein KDJ86_15285 [Bauldia sp.]|uniref:hypothetical protein n=1 Tax=Bauldia sp. TaxID=2575872 RepID=UPI001D5FDEDF|nr:hypothetical protein [Bauldia sp.]MCB1497151.1 hypothetical protein [Bauldia sp.]
MNRRVLSLAVGAIALAALTGAGHAQDAKPMTAQQAEKAKIASGVIAVGRADQDPMMLIVGAKLLADVGAGGEKPASAGSSKAFDVSQILDEAKALAGDNQYLLDEIATLSSRPERSGERYCNWYTNCGYDVTDPFACEEVYVCN